MTQTKIQREMEDLQLQSDDLRMQVKKMNIKLANFENQMEAKLDADLENFSNEAVPERESKDEFLVTRSKEKGAFLVRSSLEDRSLVINSQGGTSGSQSVFWEKAFEMNSKINWIPTAISATIPSQPKIKLPSISSQKPGDWLRDEPSGL
ncbi:OLC1v1008052C1 [Oldenlandia corymbosa var. corymbosa]|uniref:OLC1v1008052C1 n=1 Tax=Oldenlandia corymbosa var. corymbosa TaxID=529605 RepID=A0AAV1DP38_OLDCO|nr:OLC1v1008052C1 [Oldenlandia corymbosa var. corymbosa]